MCSLTKLQLSERFRIFRKSWRNVWWLKYKCIYCFNNYPSLKVKYYLIIFKEPPFVFRSKTLPEKKEDINYYKNETTGYYYYGYCIDLVYRIKEKMNFEFTLYEPDDLSYGTMQDDGSWNGIVKELLEEVRLNHLNHFVKYNMLWLNISLCCITMARI